MGTAARIFIRDLNRILHNPAAVIIMVGVCLIPSLYAWINILANWDPYANTAGVPVSVVIEDEGAEIPGMGEMNAGELVRERLEENHQLAWTFVDSKDAAREDVESGRSYAAFIIPRDFTATLAGVLDGKAEPAKIAYYVNEKANAIAPKVTDTGATELESQISEEFTRTVGEVATEKLSAAAAQTRGGAVTAETSAAQTLHDTSSSLSELATSLADMDDTIATSRAAISSARTSLADMGNQTTSLAQTLDGALDELATARTGAQTLAGQLTQAMSSSAGEIAGISSTAAYDIGALAGDVGWAQGKLDGTIAQVKALNATLEDMLTSLKSMNQGGETSSGDNAGLGDQIDALEKLLKAQQEHLDRLQQLSDDIKAASDTTRGLTTSVADAIQNGSSSLTGLEGQLSSSALPGVSSALDTFAEMGGQATGSLGALAPAADQASSLLQQLDDVLGQTETTIDDVSATLSAASERIGTLAGDVDALQSSQAMRALQDLVQLDPKRLGEHLASPVDVAMQAVFPVANYGSGVAPFYTNLALWVGGFVLVTIYKLEVDTEGMGRVRPWQAYLGRWMLLAVLGQAQAIICCTGDLVLGVQCVSPAAFIVAGMAASLTYVLVVYSLAVAFKHIGKALGVLLVVLQIPGAAGTYPIEMMPGFFQALHPWLPFTYGIDAMREAVAGFYGDYYLTNLLALLMFCVPALAIGLGARKRLLAINTLFDHTLARTDLMVSEHIHAGEHLAAGTLFADPARATRFERAYPRLVRRGLAVLAGVPLALLALLFILPAKLPLLILWIASLVGTCTYLIVVEYLHERARGAHAANARGKHAAVSAERA